MFAPIFTLKLNHKIHPRTVTVGKYDGEHPCLTCGTTASKVFIHNPHKPAIAGGRVAVQVSDVSLLNVNQSVTALCAGKLDPSIDRDMLCVGTQTNLLAYDIHDNKDLFYKEVPDGVNSIAIGKVANVDSPLAIAGGNCTLIGFDAKGEDKFWTVTGDIVSSLALADFTNNGENELLVGSEDFEIRAFHYDEIIAEMTETEAVTALCPVAGSRFGYGLANGTVGVYDRSTRYWRIKVYIAQLGSVAKVFGGLEKPNIAMLPTVLLHYSTSVFAAVSKNEVMAIHSYDLDGDGVPELITGWSNGKIEARSSATGEVIFTDNMTSAVAGIVDADYRLDGKTQLICCSVEGEVRGYQSDKSKMSLIGSHRASDDIKDLNVLKQNLLLEIDNYENKSQSIKSEDMTTTQKIEEAAIPVNTDVNLLLTVEEKDPPRIQLSVSSTNQTIVRMVVIFAEGLFNGESYVEHPRANKLSNNVDVSLFPTKDIPVEMHVNVFLSLPGSPQFHVFERVLNLPRFSSYVYTPSLTAVPESNVTFQVNERLQRIAIWFSDNFILTQEIPCEKSITANFIAIRGGDLCFKADASGRVTIATDNIDLAGDLIQSLAAFLRLESLQVTAYFPVHMKKLKEIMESVDSLHSVTQRLAAEMTDHSNLIRSLVVRAEDARLQDDFTAMRKGYMELHELNRDLIGGYHVRSTNHEELVKSLKLVNQIIQKAAHLRVGKYQTQVVSQCRDAIKNNKIPTLIKIIQAGTA